MKIISADDRIASYGSAIKGILLGKFKIGKTSQLWTLNPDTTLFIDIEAGGLSVQGWQGDSLEPKTWEECRDIACFIGGPNPALRQDQCYSQAHYEHVLQLIGNVNAMSKYQTIFIDSISVASRLCLQYCKGQPEAFSEKSGKYDNRGAYGLLAKEMVGWITQLQHAKLKNVWFVAILDEKMDDYNRKYFAPQIEGTSTALQMPGIVDEVIVMTDLKDDEGKPYRAFICQQPNPWGYPAGDRSGTLDLIEPPSLGALMDKIKAAKRIDPLTFDYKIKN